MIREADFVQSVADALQFISYYHPVDYIEHLGRAYEREQSPAAKDAIAQILTNSRMRGSLAAGWLKIWKPRSPAEIALPLAARALFDFCGS